MVKRTATTAVFLLVLSFTAFAESFTLTGPGSDTVGGVNCRPIKYHKPCVPVPEPASVLAFGTVLLLGGRSLKRKFGGR